MATNRTTHRSKTGKKLYAVRGKQGRRELARKLKQLQQDRCPFIHLPTEGSSRWGGGVSAEYMKELNWTKPELVVQIRFVEWTAEGRLRHSKFLGMRSDKDPVDVHRE